MVAFNKKIKKVECLQKSLQVETNFKKGETQILHND